MVSFNDTILEARANKMRDRLGISNADPVDPYKALAELNVVTVFGKLTEDFSGMAIKAGENGFMLVNTNQTKGRQHFTIGHELYHLYVQPNFTAQLCRAGRFDKKDREEFNADIFSTYLLMPKAGILNMIPEEELGRGGEISLETIVALEQHFGVSRSALLNRLARLDLIKIADYEQYRTNVKQSAYRLGYSTGLYEKESEYTIIGDYGTLCKKLFEEEKISESHYHSLMQDIGVNIDETFDENEWDS